MTEKKSYCSAKQKMKLVEAVIRDQELTSGKFSPTFTYKDSQKRWTAIAEMCNAIPGANKDWKHWRKTWQDIRSKTKQKQTKLNKHAAGTGGGPSQSSLTRTEEIVLGTISAQAVSGNTSIMEGDASFEFTNAEEEDLQQNEGFEASDSEEETIVVEYCDIPDNTRTLPAESLPSSCSSNAKVNTWTPPSFKAKLPADKLQSSGNSHATAVFAVTNVNASTPRKTKAKLAAESLKSSATATEILAEVSKNELTLKEQYYKKKLEYLNRQTIAIEQIAQALVQKIL